MDTITELDDELTKLEAETHSNNIFQQEPPISTEETLPVTLTKEVNKYAKETLSLPSQATTEEKLTRREFGMDDLIRLTSSSCGGKLVISPGTTSLICQQCGMEYLVRWQGNNPVLKTNALGDRKMKKCPFCAEEIQDEAILCRYCGRELTSPKPKNWKYRSVVFHFRNSDESGWLKADGTPAAQAAQHFWNEVHQLVVDIDRTMIDNGWEVVQPRDPSCIKIELVRDSKGYDPTTSAVNAVFTLGGSLISQAMGFQKWWPSSITLRWKRPAKENKEQIHNLYMNTSNNNEWERFEQNNLTKKWYLWRRPKDFDADNPDDDRWVMYPYPSLRNDWAKPFLLEILDRSLLCFYTIQ